MFWNAKMIISQSPCDITVSNISPGPKCTIIQRLQRCCMGMCRRFKSSSLSSCRHIIIRVIQPNKPTVGSNSSIFPHAIKDDSVVTTGGMQGSGGWGGSSYALSFHHTRKTGHFFHSRNKSMQKYRIQFVHVMGCVFVHTVLYVLYSCFSLPMFQLSHDSVHNKWN